MLTATSAPKVPTILHGCNSVAAYSYRQSEHLAALITGIAQVGEKTPGEQVFHGCQASHVDVNLVVELRGINNCAQSQYALSR